MKYRKIFHTTVKVLRENIILTILLTAAMVMSIVFSLIPPQLLRIVIDDCLIGANENKLLSLALIYFLIILLSGISDLVKAALLTMLGQKLIRQLRVKMYIKLERISVRYFADNSEGEITSRFLNDVDSVNTLFTDGVISMFIDCFKIIGIIISVFVFSVKLGFVAIALTPVVFVITRIFRRAMFRAQVKNLEQLGRVNGHISESIKNIRMIKVFNREHYMEKLYSEKLSENFRSINKVNVFDSCYSPIIQLIRTMLIAMIVILSSGQLNILGISAGMIAASIELITNLFKPIEALGMELQNVQKGMSGMKRVEEFLCLDEEPEKNHINTDALINIGEVDFKHVTFGYTKENTVITDLSEHIAAGESITFAGRTGVGKTTLFRLILGLLKPDKGSVTIGGGKIEVYDIPNTIKRHLFGYVEQQFSFIPGTIEDQISLKDVNIDHEAVVEVMKFVGLHDYVMTLENNYMRDSSIETDFSQGQLQLLAIARAIVAKPKILLLDEVTANLDMVTEEKVISVLKHAQEGRTVLSISHRLATIMDCDRVLHLE